MTDQDLRDLRDLQTELAAVEQSPWQPSCVARTFASSARKEFVFTMQVWMDLDAVQSPFLIGMLPPAETAGVEFELAFRAFGYAETTPENCAPEELVVLGQLMIRVIQAGFAMRLKLNPPEGFRVQKSDENGMGDWLPVVACLKSQLHFGIAEIPLLGVGQAFALIAAHRVNEGWSVAGETYASRDVADEEE